MMTETCLEKAILSRQRHIYLQLCVAQYKLLNLCDNINEHANNN